MPAEAPITAYFTVDPIDGTRAFIRRQSHGISTMVALVDRGEVISAYIGDVSSNEVYGYRPGSSRVHRITNLDAFETLTPRDVCPGGIGEIHGLLRDPPETYSPATQALVKQFKNYEIMGSSIGTWAARQWKGEVGARDLRAGLRDAVGLDAGDRHHARSWALPGCGRKAGRGCSTSLSCR